MKNETSFTTNNFKFTEATAKCANTITYNSMNQKFYVVNELVKFELKN